MFGKMIDLTHLLNEQISVYPDTIGPEIISLNNVAEHGFAEMQVKMVLHSGTHIDAPRHIVPGGKALSDFPLEQFCGNALVIPCAGLESITSDFLKAFEPQIERVDFILFYTGWQTKWKTDAYFQNCPSLTREAATWLTTFALKGIGLDAFSVDPIVSAHVVTEENLPNHHILLGKEILLIENLTNLDKLPDTIFDFQCLPLKIEHADGSPVRAVAFV